MYHLPSYIRLDIAGHYSNPVIERGLAVGSSQPLHRPGLRRLFGSSRRHSRRYSHCNRQRDFLHIANERYQNHFLSGKIPDMSRLPQREHRHRDMNVPTQDQSQSLKHLQRAHIDGMRCRQERMCRGTMPHDIYSRKRRFAVVRYGNHLLSEGDDLGFWHIARIVRRGTRVSG